MIRSSKICQLVQILNKYLKYVWELYWDFCKTSAQGFHQIWIVAFFDIDRVGFNHINDNNIFKIIAIKTTTFNPYIKVIKKYI